MTRRLSFVAVLMLLAVLVAFPEGTKEGAKSAAKDMTLDIAAMAGWANIKPVWDRAAAFTQSTGGTWRLHEFPAADFPTKQLMELKEGTKAFDLVDGTASTCLLYRSFMMPLNDLIKRDFGSVEAWMKRMPKEILDLVTYDGKVLYWPFHANGQFMAYRKVLFEDPKEKAAFKARYGYDLKPPSTWDQLIDAAEFFGRPEKDLWGFQFMGKGNPGGFTLVSSLLAEGVKLADFQAKEAPFKKPGPDRDAALRVLRTWEKLRARKLVPPGVSNMAHTETVEFYKAGKAAMSYGWWGDHMSKIRDPLVVKAIGESGTFEMPTSKGGVYLSIHAYGIVKTADNPELAWQFLKFIGSRDVQLAMAEASGQASPDIEYNKEGIAKGYIPAAMQGVLNGGVILGSPEQMLSVVTIYTRYASDFFAGNHTAEGFLDFLAKETEKTLRE